MSKNNNISAGVIRAEILLLLHVLTHSIIKYFYSAISKIDFTFAESVTFEPVKKSL